MDKNKVEQLIDSYLAGTCTLAEKALVERFYMEELLKRDPLASITGPLQKKKAMWEVIHQKTNSGQLKKRKLVPYFFKSRLTAAAVLLLVAAGFYFYPRRTHQQAIVNSEQTADIKPGGNKAILSLSNGKHIILDDTENGLITHLPGMLIKKSKDGQLIYTAENESGEPGQQEQFNLINTPKGGQYQLVLSDGTQVWLNAASSLRFPERFIGKERNVELKGEAYFEVAKNKNRPFKVKSGKQTIEVLGTHFNISSYSEDQKSKTTLLEGSVRIVSSDPDRGGSAAFKGQILKPGQQAVLSGDQLHIISVESSDEIAWKNGKFMFNNEELGSILTKVARWYDVDISYEQEYMKKNTYWGTVSRFDHVSKVLKMLALTGDVHFKIEGRTIRVMK